jgi:CheY-like chemotaxis protein
MTSFRPKILIVDDEMHMIRLIGFALRSIKADLVTAGSGLDALQILRREKVDLAIFDVHMRDIDGLSALKELRADAATAHIPVVLITAAGDTDLEETGSRLGAQAFFRKPFSPAQLAGSVGALLANCGLGP